MAKRFPEVTASILVLLIFAVSSGVTAQSGPYPHQEEDVTSRGLDEPGVLKDMPWFDRERDGYKKYSKEDVTPLLPERAKEDSPGMPAIPGSLIEFVRIAIYFAIAVMAAILIYFIILRFREGRDMGGRRLKDESDILHQMLTDSLSDSSKTRTPSTLEELASTIRKCILEESWLEASIYIFLFALVSHFRTGKLKYGKELTARNYLKQLQELPGVDEVERNMFRKSVQAFEIALYGEQVPDSRVVQETWEHYSKMAGGR